MLDFRFRTNWLVVACLVLEVACASTTLAVPENAAANPDAETMPLGGETEVLEADYDAWATEPAAGETEQAPAGSGHEGHQGHQHD